jgi:hypothetical protein
MSELERLVYEMAELNVAFYPFQIVVAILAIALTLLTYVNPGKWINRSMKIFLGVIYSLIAWGVTVCYINLQGGYYLFTAITHALVAILFFLSLRIPIIDFDLSNKKNIPLLSAFLTIYGVIIYPLVEFVLGYSWPRMFVFGALCPTGIYAIGTLLSSFSTANKTKQYLLLLSLISLGAIICGGRTILIGGVFDFSYFGSGLLGLYQLREGWAKM